MRSPLLEGGKATVTMDPRLKVTSCSCQLFIMDTVMRLSSHAALAGPGLYSVGGTIFGLPCFCLKTTARSTCKPIAHLGAKFGGAERLTARPQRPARRSADKGRLPIKYLAGGTTRSFNGQAGKRPAREETGSRIFGLRSSK